MTIGSRIARLRAEHNLSQGDLARELGISRQAVSKWERDLSSPDTLNLVKLAQLLDTDLEYLAMGTYPEKIPPQIVIQLLDHSDQQPAPLPPVPAVRRRKHPPKIRLNPVFWGIFAAFWFLIGLLVGFIF